MKVQKTIEAKLQAEFSPQFLQVINESHQHSVPPNSETHFRVELVSDQFQHLNRVARSRKIYTLLAEELASGVHALSLQLFSPSEWQARGEEAGNPSPACHGGSAKDRG